jgi:hypothetical protein
MAPPANVAVLPSSGRVVLSDAIPAGAAAKMARTVIENHIGKSKTDDAMQFLLSLYERLQKTKAVPDGASPDSLLAQQEASQYALAMAKEVEALVRLDADSNVANDRCKHGFAL